MPSFCRLDLPLRTYGLTKTMEIFYEIRLFYNAYTGYFVLFYYVVFANWITFADKVIK